MIPVEIVVTFVIGWLIYKGVSATFKLRAARSRIAVVEEENIELRETVIRLGGDQPKAGPGWTSKQP